MGDQGGDGFFTESEIEGLEVVELSYDEIEPREEIKSPKKTATSKDYNWAWISAPQVSPPMNKLHRLEQYTKLIDIFNITASVMLWQKLVKHKGFEFLYLLAIVSGFKLATSPVWIQSPMQAVGATLGSVGVILAGGIINFRKVFLSFPRLVLMLSAVATTFIQLILAGLRMPETTFGFLLKGAYMFITGAFCRSIQKISKVRLDKVFLKPRTFPSKASDVTKDWLTTALRKTKSIPSNTKVASFHIDPLSTSTRKEEEDDNEIPRGFIGETVRITVTYSATDDASTEEDDRIIGPVSIIAKFPTQNWFLRDQTRVVGLYLCETAFYRIIVPNMKLHQVQGADMLRVPKPYVVEYDDRDSSFVMLLEDVAPDLKVGDELVGGSFHQACSIAVRYARFHAVNWKLNLKSINKKYSWLRCYGWMSSPDLVLAKLFDESFEDVISHERFCKYIPHQMQKLLKRFGQHLPLVIKELTTTPGDNSFMENFFSIVRSATLPSGADNLYDRERADWVAVDWQTLCKGVGVYDLAYFVSLDINDSDMHESKFKRGQSGQHEDPMFGDRFLVNLYYSTLKASNVNLTTYTFEQCLEDYRIGVLIAALIPIVVMRDANIGTQTDDRAKLVREAMLQRSMRAIQRVNSEEVMLKIINNNLVKQKKARMKSCMLHKLSTNHISQVAFAPTDEFFNHHTPSSLSMVPEGSKSSDAYDRYFMNGYAGDGSVFFAAALGVYPSRRVVDAAFCIVINGMQHNIRASRSLYEHEFKSDETAEHAHIINIMQGVGPISINMIEPLMSIQLVVYMPNENIDVNLIMKARYEPHMEPHFSQRLPGVGAFEYDRMTQLVEWNGNINFPGLNQGDQLEVCSWYGCRDRSWGYRPHPSAESTVQKQQLKMASLHFPVARDIINKLTQYVPKKPQFYWVWSPINLRNGGVMYHTQEDESGNPLNVGSCLFGDAFKKNEPRGKPKAKPFAPLSSPQMLEPDIDFCSTPRSFNSDTSAFNNDASPKVSTPHSFVQYGDLDTCFKVKSAGHSARLQPGTRVVDNATIVLVLEDNRRLQLKVQPLYNFYMSGLGYNHPTYGHGRKQPHELSVTYDKFHVELVDKMNPLYWHVQAVSTVSAEWISSKASKVVHQQGHEDYLDQFTGICTFEQLSVGKHQPSGFSCLCDPAPSVE